MLDNSHSPGDLSAIKLPFENGEYLATWSVPDENDDFVEIPGSLLLHPDSNPRGVIYGDLPVTGRDSGVIAYPQSRSFDVLIGSLSNGASVALVDGKIDYAFHHQGTVTGTLAILSRKPFSNNEIRSYNTIDVQIEGLESISGVAPIEEVNIPNGNGKNGVWSAHVHGGAKSAWDSDEQSMEFTYNYRARALDFYEFRLAFGPNIRITLSQALTVDGWWSEWVYPLKQLISLLTGKPREIHYLLVSGTGSSSSPRKEQVFGLGITEHPVNSSNSRIKRTNSLVNLSVDDLNFFELLKSWKRLSTTGQPLVQTYSEMVTQEDLHPRSHFLLLLQALEGSYGFQHREQQEAMEEQYSKKRDTVLECAKARLPSADLKFIKKNLFKRPQQGLTECLDDLLKRLPDEIRNDLDRSALVAAVRNQHQNGPGEISIARAITIARNTLSHGTGEFDPNDLMVVCMILDRAVRAEAIRLLGVPAEISNRAAKKRQR